MPAQDFAEKIAIVTGASSGLGRAICVELASRGAAVVVINYASNRTGAEETASLVSKHGAEALVVQGDVGDKEACVAVVESVAAHGRLDVLFNNAGITTFAKNHGDLDAVDADDFARIYRTNVIGAYQMIAAGRALMEKANDTAAVVNTASLAGVAGIGSSVPYACSKGALLTLTLSLARALAPKIRVNAVCPGFIDTPWYATDGSEKAAEERRQAIAARVPLKLASAAEDIAGPAVFLASPAARHITGESLLVDAGSHLNLTSLTLR
jgi:NAD(P)-dependent dehydrogenase (short-subunit alcohol dehydrogenase family)